MSNSLPPFGDISGIDYEGSSIHEQQTITEIIHADVQNDSQETQFNFDIDVGNDNEMSMETGSERDNLNQKSIAPGSASVNQVRSEETQFTESEPELLECPLISGALDTQEDDVINNTTDPAETQYEASPEVDSEPYPRFPILQQSDEEEITNNEDGQGDVTEGLETDYIEKQFTLPLAKIKRIMQTDPDSNLLAKEALAAVAISTEHFLAMLAQQSFKLAVRSKKKRITLEHLRSTITSCAACDFLEGTLPDLDI